LNDELRLLRPLASRRVDSVRQFQLVISDIGNRCRSDYLLVLPA